VIEHMDNIPRKDIIQYLIDIDYMINQPEKKDFVDLAYTKCPDNPIIQMIHLMMEMGASLATVSRYSTGDGERLSVKSIVEYLHGNLLAVSTVSYKRALELYRLFIEKGFSLKTIN